MGILMFTMRISSLMHRKHQIEYELLKVTKKLTDFTKYSALVGNGSISIGDLLKAPGSLMGRTMGYLSYAHYSALQYMQQNAPYMQQMYAQQTGAQQNPQQQQLMQNYIMRSLYMQGRERAAQIETKNLKEIEEEISRKKASLETELQMISEDLKSAKEARDSGIKDMAPKYVA